LFETVPANNRIPQAVRQGIPDRRTSHTESASAIGAELVARYNQELSGGGSKMYFHYLVDDSNFAKFRNSLLVTV